MADGSVAADALPGPDRGAGLEYLTPRSIAVLLERHGVRPSKALGQNFLADANHVRRICDLAAIRPGDRVVEIGPGLGSLTVGLLNSGASVLTIEKDTRLADALAETAPGASIVNADALDLDLRDVVTADLAPPVVLVANLPYSVGTTLLLDVLERVPEITRGLVMVQREVADRLVAEPGSKAYGAVSVFMQYWAAPRSVGRVPPTVFVPRPRVYSSLVAFDRHPPPGPSCSRAHLFELVRAGFSRRRKTLANAIADLPWRDAALAACSTVGIDPSVRAETLGVAEFAAITAAAGETP